jgi:predicted enzyme related to lactoylglutathione lyase
MITNVSIISIYVTDQDEALRFYTDVLGLEARDDITMGDGYRWLTVGSPEQPELMINLAIPGPPLDPESAETMRRLVAKGSMNAAGFQVDDCRKTHEQLVAKGVTFMQEPADRPYGVEAVCRDNSGNWIVLVEPKAYSAEDFTQG